MKNPDRHTRPHIGETRQRLVGLRNFLILPRLFYMRYQPIQIYFWAAIINLVPSIANATDDAERIASMATNVQSAYLTSFEKSLFTEASSRFKKYIIPNSIQSGGAFWLDNERLDLHRRHADLQSGTDVDRGAFTAVLCAALDARHTCFTQTAR